MRYDNLRAFEKHLEGAAPNHFSPLYLVVGKEEYDRKEAVTRLLHALLPGENDRDLGLSIWEGGQADPKELMSDLDSQSFFVSKRLILIQQAEKLKKSTLEALENFIARGSRTPYLVISGESFSRASSFYKGSEKAGVILEFPELKPWEKEKRLAEWVNKQAAAQRKVMAYPLCQEFVKQIGFDQQTLSSELEKLFCYVDERKEIGWNDVEKICTLAPLESVWQLGEAIFRRDGAAALTIIEGILLDGQPLLPLLRQIRGQFATDYQVAIILAEGGGPSEVTQIFPYMKGAILEKHLQAARYYGIESFRKGILAIDAAELKAKNSQLTDQLIAELLIVQLIRLS